MNGFPALEIDKSGGSRDGWLYIVSSQINFSPAGSDPDVVFHRSSDGGITWSSGIRVNQDPLNNGKNQVFPALTIDESGGINVIYMDNRNSPDSAQIYLSRSTNGGVNWTDYIVSDHKFLPKSVSGAGAGNQGDNIGITNTNNKLFPVWNDDITGVYQVWTAPIDLTTIGINQISTEIPDGFYMSQNFPNPFNPETIIKYELSEAGYTELKIYDIQGKLVGVLVNENQGSGEYSVKFDGSRLAGGVYYYKLSVNGGDKVMTKKLVLLK